MEAYYFSEQPYPGAWDEDVESLRVTLPNRLCDPHVAADLINARLDEWELCDKVGINVMINEHHSSATCLSPSNTITLAMLARRTEHVRLLGLGFPLANRPDPVRLAEEIAYHRLRHARQARRRLLEGRPVRDFARQFQPGALHGAVLGQPTISCSRR